MNNKYIALYILFFFSPSYDLHASKPGTKPSSPKEVSKTKGTETTTLSSKASSVMKALYDAPGKLSEALVGQKKLISKNSNSSSSQANSSTMPVDGLLLSETASSVSQAPTGKKPNSLDLSLFSETSAEQTSIAASRKAQNLPPKPPKPTSAQSSLTTAQMRENMKKDPKLSEQDKTVIDTMSEKQIKEGYDHFVESTAPESNFLKIKLREKISEGQQKLLRDFETNAKSLDQNLESSYTKTNKSTPFQKSTASEKTSIDLSKLSETQKGFHADAKKADQGLESSYAKTGKTTSITISSAAKAISDAAARISGKKSDSLLRSETEVKTPSTEPTAQVKPPKPPKPTAKINESMKKELSEQDKTAIDTMTTKEIKEEYDHVAESTALVKDAKPESIAADNSTQKSSMSSQTSTQSKLSQDKSANAAVTKALKKMKKATVQEKLNSLKTTLEKQKSLSNDQAELKILASRIKIIDQRLEDLTAQAVS